MKSGEESKSGRCFPKKHNLYKMYTKCEPYIEMRIRKKKKQYFLPVKLH